MHVTNSELGYKKKRKSEGKSIDIYMNSTFTQSTNPGK